jgi:hypothetical protein
MPDPKPATEKKRDRSRSAHSQTIQLRSGGSITLAGTFNLFTMSTEDVEFVSELGRKMRAYNEQQAETKTGSVGTPVAALPPRGLPRSNPN